MMGAKGKEDHALHSPLPSLYLKIGAEERD